MTVQVHQLDVEWDPSEEPSKKPSRFRRRLQKMIDKIQYAYWGVVPHDWRPGQLWYRFKCWAHHRHTTVKPRTLDFHTWCDRTMLLPHMMFEILTQFIEGECGEDCPVDWEGSGHMIEIDGKEVNVRKEMQDLYDWWNKDYLVNVDHTHDKWHEIRSKHCKDVHKPIDLEGNEVPRDDADFFQWLDEWDTPELEAMADELFKEAYEKERFYAEELKERMCRLSRVHEYMWT